MLGWDLTGFLIWISFWFIIWDLWDTYKYGDEFTSLIPYGVMMFTISVFGTVSVAGVIRTYVGIEIGTEMLLFLYLMSLLLFNYSIKTNQPFFFKLYVDIFGRRTRKYEDLPLEVKLTNPSQAFHNSSNAYLVDISKSNSLFIPFDSMEDLNDFIIKNANRSPQVLYSDHCESCNQVKNGVFTVDVVHGPNVHPESVCQDCLEDICERCLERSDDLDSTDVLLKKL